MIKLARVSTESIEKILQEAQQFADGKVSKIKGDVFAANLFFENSTRTKTSFEVLVLSFGFDNGFGFEVLVLMWLWF